jgi:hypothetical protein
MKKLQDMTADLIQNLPKFNQSEMVTHVFNNAQICLLDAPTSPAEVCCPMCGGFSGFRIRDGQGIVWSCTGDNCIQINAGMHAGAVSYKRPQMTIVNCGAPDLLKDASFDKLDQPKEVRVALQDYCKGFRGFILLAGASGNGKTYASCCIMRKYLENGNDCRFVNVSDLYLVWLELKQTGRTEAGLLEKYASCELLVIDDIGTRIPTEGFLDFLYLLINKRVSNTTLGTVVSTNMKSTEMSDKLGSPILSRLASGVIVKFPGLDRRTQQF